MSFRSETPDNNYAQAHVGEVTETIEKAVSIVSERNYHCSFYSQVNEDEDFNSKFSNALGVAYLPNNIVNFDYKEYFVDFGVVISNRLHVLLPAMGCGIIPIALISRDHKKIESLFIAQGWEEYIVYTDEINRLSDLLCDIESNFSHHKAELYNSLLEAQRHAQRHIKLIAELK